MCHESSQEQPNNALSDVSDSPPGAFEHAVLQRMPIRCSAGTATCFGNACKGKPKSPFFCRPCDGSIRHSGTPGFRGTMGICIACCPHLPNAQ